MYAVMGVTGKVGAAVAASLLDSGAGVRVVLRDQNKAAAWAARGAEIAVADYQKPEQLAPALAGVAGAFVMLPAIFDPQPGFPEAHAAIAALHEALLIARPAKVVCLSTIGADAEQPNLLNQLKLLEESLRTLPMPITFLRAAWFLDNAALDVDAARTRGEIDSYLQPLDQAVPMVAAADVGATAAQLLQDAWQGSRIVELEGPRRVSPNDIAHAFGDVLGRPVRAVAVPRDTWLAAFSAYGMQNPAPRAQMLDGFNAGWIRFAGGGTAARRGQKNLADVIRTLTGSKAV